MWKKVRRPQEEKSRYIKRLKKCWIYKENQDMKKLVSTDFSVENWLILGEKWSMMIATADKYGCRTLPMRNWHSWSPYGWIFNWNLSRSDITYEELTHSTEKNISFLLFYVGHYLWGIDTFLTGIYPMDISPHILSDITYEELTLVYIAGRIPVIRSDITYEELTHSDVNEASKYAVAAGRTLPMRNWHT